MSNKIAIVVEGPTERDFLNCLSLYFDEEIEVISLPVGRNLYSLWKELQDDEDLDVLGVLIDQYKKTCGPQKDGKNKYRWYEEYSIDSFSEVYLLFDFDYHQRNLPININPIEYIKQLLEFFSNETDKGKLFLSFPMLEAVKDIGICETSSKNDCYISSINNIGYKQLVGSRSKYTQFVHFNKSQTWELVCNEYCNRIFCLFDLECNENSFIKIKNVEPIEIFNKQTEKISLESHFLCISGIVNFLFSYFTMQKLIQYNFVTLTNSSFLNQPN